MEEVTSIDTGKSKFLIHGTGKYEVLGSTSVIGFDDSYDYEGDFLLTARVGAAGELYRHSGKVKISDNTVFIQGEQLDFIYYSLLNFDIKKLSFGTGQPLIKASELKTLDIKVPEDTSEQKKIGELFFNLDSLIALQQRKYERLQHLKQALLRKMFPKPGEQVPELRFEGFTEPWKERKLGELVDVCNGRDYKHLDKGVIPVYGTGGYMTSVSEALSYSKDAIGIGRKGTIDRPYILRAPFWTVDTLFYAIPKHEVDLDFAFCLFSNINWRSKDESSGVPSLSKQAIDTTRAKVPGTDEQRIIGTFFRNLDSLIALQQSKYERLQHLKQALLQKMFA